jgi:hypothetical protein
VTLGVRHLGFLVPIEITMIQGRQWRIPQRGVCAECLEHRPKVFVRGDGSLYCDHCIEFDLAEARPEGFIQNHPAPFPIEDMTGAHRIPPAFIEAFP